MVTGLMFTMHGTQKLLGYPGNKPAVELTSLPGVAASIEVLAGTLIMVGLFGSLAAFLASGEMAVAYFMAHFPRAFWPIENQGELAVLYCFIFLYVAAHGSGMWSLDSLWHRRLSLVEAGQRAEAPRREAA
jgi:putative oxidoreductase